MSESDDHCDLCVLERCTRWYWESKYFVVLDCRTCGVPMVVLKRHSLDLTEDEQVELDSIAQEMPDLQMGNFTFRGTMRKIPDHWHQHLVPR